MSFIRTHLISITLAGSLVLAAASGFFAASALGLLTAGSPPTTTTTINVATGETGPQGPPGPGLTLKGTVATPADLPSTGNTPGDAYIVSSDGSMRVWDGTKWVSGGPVGGTGGGTGANDCPTGSQFEAVVIDHPGGHVTIWTCVAQ